MTRLLRGVWFPWWNVGMELLTALDGILVASPKAVTRLGLLLLATLAAWFAYVPLHELLHAFGCMATGGSVDELQIQALYGGRLLEKVFPFVRAGGKYAGRLTRFDTRGSDLTYLATVFAPFLLTVLFLFPLLRAARRRGSAALLGLVMVLASAPLVSLAGDLYEIGSILVSAGLLSLGAGSAGGRALALRHDDLLALLGEFETRFPERRLAWGLGIGVSALLGGATGSLIFAVSRRWGELFRARRQPPDPSMPEAECPTGSLSGKAPNEG